MLPDTEKDNRTHHQLKYSTGNECFQNGFQAGIFGWMIIRKDVQPIVSSKGKDIRESELIMAEYLLPTTALTICEKQQMFAVKNQMK